MAYKERKRILFFGLPWTFTTYQVTEELITTRSGILRRIENDCYMYKIVDVRLETSLLERLFGLGTVHCFGGDVTDPDLLIRTSGEQRLSNYLLWQLAYSEFYFTPVPWPDFSKAELEKAVEAYNQRDRRYGGVKEEA